MDSALAADLAELLEFELALDFFDVLIGEVIGAFADTALQAQKVILGHEIRG